MSLTHKTIKEMNKYFILMDFSDVFFKKNYF